MSPRSQANDPPRLATGRVIKSPNSQASLSIDRELGAGGFGRAYLAKVRGRDKAHYASQSKVCVKVTSNIKGWVREAYFGLLLSGEDRALRVFEFFPLQTRARLPLYCLVTEYASGGDLGKHLDGRRSTWSEKRVCREVVALLRVLNVLHERNGLHRDVTPLNVFVCAGDHLKLGDFGVAAQALRGNAVAAETMTAAWSPPEKWTAGKHEWRACDDIYQVGQLLGMLLRGDATSRLTPADVRRLRCSDELKEIIQRCVGEAANRYANASQLIRAMMNPESKTLDRVRSLAGMEVVFTGKLRVHRLKAARCAQQAGASVGERVTAATDVVVRGRPSPNQNAGSRGTKLIKARALSSRGRKVRVIGEKLFWKLVDRIDASVS